MELNKDTKYLAVSAVPLSGFRRAGFSFASHVPTLFALRKLKRDDGEMLDLAEVGIVLLGIDDRKKVARLLGESMLYVRQLKRPPRSVKELLGLSQAMAKVTHKRLRTAASDEHHGEKPDGHERGKELRKNKNKGKKPDDVEVKKPEVVEVRKPQETDALVGKAEEK